ncbi:MAG: hypothetical protein ACRERR_00575 [Moraxellaceae bacterium]
MQLADLRLAVRPRNTWEAMDLGTRLVQSEAGLLWKTWACVTLPVFLLVLALVLATGNTWYYLLLWWLKPLYDYALLIVLSRRVFGETPSLRSILSALAGSWRQGLFNHLLIRRFSMSRSYLLPVWLLEQLPSGERSTRISLMRNQYTGRARWLFIVMLHFEMLLMLTALSLVFWLAPSGQTGMLWELFTEDNSNQLVHAAQLLAYFFAMTVVEPFYVAAGFSLYLNRRTELEAWDLELAFRHLRERLDAQGRRS